MQAIDLLYDDCDEKLAFEILFGINFRLVSKVAISIYKEI